MTTHTITIEEYINEYFVGNNSRSDWEKQSIIKMLLEKGSINSSSEPITDQLKEEISEIDLCTNDQNWYD